MKTRLKRALAAVGVVAAVAGIAPILTASPAFAAGSLQGSATIKNAGGAANLQSGNSSTLFTLTLPNFAGPTPPAGPAACEGDSVAGYRVSSYFVPSSVDPSTLTFGSSGPQGAGNRALFTGGSPYNNSAVSLSAGDGAIINIPDFDFSLFNPGDIAPGVYNAGIACVNAGVLGRFWNVQMTVTQDVATGGPAQIHFENGTAPAAPVITGVTGGAVVAGSGQLSVAFTTGAANPALTSCDLTISTTQGGAAAAGLTGGGAGSCTSPRVVTGATYGQQYFARATATNAVGTSAASNNNLSATPVRPSVGAVSATPNPNNVALDWADAPLLGGDNYNVAICTLPAPPVSPEPACTTGIVNAGTTSNYTFTGVAGQLYTFTVTYGAVGTSAASSVQSTPLSNSILVQDITVGRPNGALVLTQVCGKWDAMAAEPAQFGFPGGLGASALSATGSAPTTGGAPGGPADGQFNEYPYPENPDGTPNPTYPTHCGIQLNNAHLVTQGGSAMGAGQFFAAEGRLNQVTVVDTRDTDPGWAVNFTMGAFTSGPNTLSGNQLGWSAQKTDTPAFEDGTGFSYDQIVNVITGSMTPNTHTPTLADGASAAHTIIQAPNATPGLGIATLDARIKVLIPVHAMNGVYAGTLTINAL